MRYIQFTPIEIKILKEHISKDNIKYTLNGIFFSDIEKDTIVAIDGRRLLSITKKFNDSLKGKIIVLPNIKSSEGAILDSKKMNWIIYPKKTNIDIAVLIKDTKEADIELPSKVCDISVTVLNGKFPNYKMFIPTKPKPVVKIGLNGGFFMKGFKYSLNIEGPLSPIVGTISDLNNELDYNPRIVIMPMKIE